MVGWRVICNIYGAFLVNVMQSFDFTAILQMIHAFGLIHLVLIWWVKRMKQINQRDKRKIENCHKEVKHSKIDEPFKNRVHNNGLDRTRRGTWDENWDEVKLMCGLLEPLFTMVYLLAFCAGVAHGVNESDISNNGLLLSDQIMHTLNEQFVLNIFFAVCLFSFIIFDSSVRFSLFFFQTGFALTTILTLCGSWSW